VKFRRFAVQATARNGTNGTNGAKGHVPGHFEAGGRMFPLVNIQKAFENCHL
jgi:hypothetical protein